MMKKRRQEKYFFWSVFWWAGGRGGEKRQIVSGEHLCSDDRYSNGEINGSILKLVSKLCFSRTKHLFLFLI